MPTPLDILKRVYGYDAFRGHQADVIDHVAGGGDALVLMPTGGGKSLCYQIPALLRPGTGVVVSPLIALMQDQVDALKELGLKAAFLNSTLGMAQVRATEAALLAGELDLLYVAPERLLQDRTLELLERVEAGPGLALFAIDEAHCVSQWGHDFRPEYMQLDILAERFPRVPRLACTATADERTREEILANLRLEGGRVYVSGFDRPEIRYRVVPKDNPRRQLLRFLREEHQGHAGIVYCLSRKKTEETAAFLTGEGIEAVAYHAGLDAETRRTRQERFLREDGLVVCATIAFGMGIDKPDVRFVAHLDLPKSMEGYYQETGRAGRDGLPADAWMCYGLQDVVLLRRIVDEGEGDEMHRRRNHQQLDAILGYCEVVSCRRQVLLAYFGETLPDPCGNCDTCLDPPDTFDGLVTAQKALSCVARTGQRFGAQHVIDVLRGSENERLLRLGHDRLSTYGIGTELDAFGWRSVFRQLVAQGYLALDPDGYGGLRLTPAAGPVLKGAVDLRLRRDALEKKAVRSKTKVAEALTADVDGEVDASTAALFERLRAVRLELAQAAGVPPYVVFHDKTLAAMALHRPVTAEQFLRLSGVGETKLERYGEAFLAVLREEAGSAPTDSHSTDSGLF
ncbi:MAG TPA: DNA helicase RecQ [Candidatus Krumholzibacteria bacterium]|nr:DNA helicase RecQ [Candidatus Krumholzibacteria bacterium]